MRKTVEVEYVGIEDIQEIMESAYALMREGHYASVELSNIGKDMLCRVMIMLDGWHPESMYDYDYSFYMSDGKTDVAAMNDCKSTINNLLSEEE